MQVNIRPIELKDFEAVAAILSLAENETVNPAQLIEAYQRPLSEGQVYHPLVAESDGRVIGYGTVFNSNNMQVGRILVKVWTHPDQRNQGVGSKLYDAASQYAYDQGAQSLASNLFDNESHSLHFAQKRGFEIERHLFESEINLAAFDMKPFADVIEQVQANGIRLFTLAEAGNTKDNLRKLWEVNYATYMDDPATTGVFPDFEAFYKMTSEESWFNPESQFLAADGDRYVGLSAIRHFPDKNTYYQLMTGVMPAYRGRKIALALKLMNIAYAKAHNGLSISTDNDSQNAPMLAINRKLGYQPLPGVYRLQKV